MTKPLTEEELVDLNRETLLYEEIPNQDIRRLISDLRAARAENERLETLFQNTHRCHSSWVAEAAKVGPLKAELSAVEAERESFRHDYNEAERKRGDAERFLTTALELLREAKGHLLPYAALFRDRIDAFLNGAVK